MGYVTCIIVPTDFNSNLSDKLRQGKKRMIKNEAKCHKT